MSRFSAQERQPSLNSLILMIAGPFILALLPLLALERGLGLLHDLTLLLALLYLALFLSLAILALAFRKLLQKRRPAFIPPWLRLALLVEAATLSCIWYKLLNPFPFGLLLATGQRGLAVGLVAVIAMAWLMFLVLLRKLPQS